MVEAKAMEMNGKYKHLAEDGMLNVISDTQDKAICKAAAELCKGNFDNFYGALCHILSTGRY